MTASLRVLEYTGTIPRQGKGVADIIFDVLVRVACLHGVVNLMPIPAPKSSLQRLLGLVIPRPVAL